MKPVYRSGPLLHPTAKDPRNPTAEEIRTLWKNAFDGIDLNLIHGIWLERQNEE